MLLSNPLVGSNCALTCLYTLERKSTSMQQQQRRSADFTHPGFSRSPSASGSASTASSGRGDPQAAGTSSSSRNPQQEATGRSGTGASSNTTVRVRKTRKKTAKACLACQKSHVTCDARESSSRKLNSLYHTSGKKYMADYKNGLVQGVSRRVWDSSAPRG